MKNETPNTKQLENPEFVAWVRQRFPNTINPDHKDFDFSVSPRSAAEAAERYQQAQASKLIRLYGEWKAGQS
jgi:hypothetical protein